MQRIGKHSKAFLLLLAFVLVLSPLSALADAGKSKTINYVALGDSLAKGTLNTNEASEGYVGKIVSDLEESGYQVNLTNKGENGFKTNDVLNGMEEITTELASADIITISVGANDVLEDLMVLIKQNPNLLSSFKPEYMTQEGIGQLQQAATNAEINAIVAESAVETATETAQKDVNAAKEAIDGVAETAGPLIATLREQLEDTIFWGNAEPIIKKLEDAIAKAETSVADDEKIGVEELQIASAALNSAIMIITEAESLLIMLPDELKQGVQLLKGNISNAATVSNTAQLSVDQAEETVNIAIEARAAADAARHLLENVLKLVDAFGKIPGKTQAVGGNIGQMLATIKSINQNAEIYVMGYYNALPYVDKAVIAPLLEGLNLAIETSTDKFGATFVPTDHLFEKESYLEPNPYNIHPNDAGYLAIAEAFMGKVSIDFPNLKQLIELEKTISVSKNQQIFIKDTDVSLLLPVDLPEGTKLTVSPTSDEAHAKAKEDGLVAVGDVLNFTFGFPEGFEDYEGIFILVMGYDADSSDNVDIYYFKDGKWASKNGEVDEESHDISLKIESFSDYGVFAKEEIKEDPPTEEPKDDDKTPPVTKDPTKGSDKDSKGDGKKATTKTSGSKLPKTATNNYALLFLGTILLISGSASLIYTRKRGLVTNDF